MLKNIAAVLMWVMISEYDLSFRYKYKLFESLNPVCQTSQQHGKLLLRPLRLTANRPITSALSQLILFTEWARPHATSTCIGLHLYC